MLGKYLKKILAMGIIALLVIPQNLCYALPEGEQVVSGSATFDRSQPNTLNINQSSDKLIANYDSFSIGLPEAVHFIQPSASSVALNRVVGGDPSAILGTLTATGKIFLINPNGIVFGAGCRLDTAGMVASTLNIADSDFLAGRYTFIGQGGSIVNQGYISAPGGYVALLGSQVTNNGIIEANLGSVALASGNAVTLNLDPQGVISVVVDQASLANADAVKNTGTIKAEGGKVILTAKTLNGVFNNAVNNEGIIEANKLNDKGGLVELTTNASINSTGTISAKGGEIKVCADGKLSLAGKYLASKTIFDPPTIDITGPVEQSGDAFYSASGDINILYNIKILDNGRIYLEADLDNDGAGNLNINNASVTTAGGCIGLKGANIVINGSTISSSGTPISDTYIPNSIYITLDAKSGSVEINNSTLEAIHSSTGDAEIDIYGDNGHVTINNSILTALRNAGGGNDAEIDIEAPNGVDISGSRLTAEVNGDDSESHIYIGPGWGNLNITNGSVLTSRINGEGLATVAFFNDIEPGEIGMEDFNIFGYGIFEEIGCPVGGFINVENSQISASAVNNMNFKLEDIEDIFDTETAVGIYMNSLGNLRLSNAQVSATDNKGIAGIGLLSGAGIDMVNNTHLTAAVNEGISAVAFGTADLIDIEGETSDDTLQNINLDATSGVTATATQGLFAAVAGLAQGQINAQGAILADGGEGVGGVALLSGGDLIAANVQAKGQFDVIGGIEYLVNNYLTHDNPVFDIDVDVTLASGILLASLAGDVYMGNVSADAVGAVALGLDGLFEEEEEPTPALVSLQEVKLLEGDYESIIPSGEGSIYSTGLVSAKVLGLLARNNIGTPTAPINTSIGALAAYSYDVGDIFINNISDNLMNIGIYVPIYLNYLEKNSEETDDPAFEIGASVAANDGIVHIKTEGDMVVNSIIAPRGGVYLRTEKGSIYAGRGWDPYVNYYEVENMSDFLSYMIHNISKGELNVSSYFLTSVITEALMEMPYSWGGGYGYFSPIMIGTPCSPLSYDGPGFNVIAGGYSYFSAPLGTIGTGTPDSKDPRMSGGIWGIVEPGVEAVTGVAPSPDFDLRFGEPSGYVLYQGEYMVKAAVLKEGGEDIYPYEGPLQIWPEDIATEDLPFDNPLMVYIRVPVDEPTKSALPEGFSSDAALTLQMGSQYQPPYFDAGQLVNPLATNYRAYYEILRQYRVLGFEPATPTTFFAYHPLTPTDLSAFDGINLDASAYDFISDNINTRKPLSAYYGG